MKEDTPLYLREFPGFELDVEIPEGFVDESWHNNASPSWFNESARLFLFVQWKEPTDRDWPESARFWLFRALVEDGEVYGMEDDALLMSDDWAEVVRVIEKEAAR